MNGLERPARIEARTGSKPRPGNSGKGFYVLCFSFFFFDVLHLKGRQCGAVEQGSLIVHPILAYLSQKSPVLRVIELQ